MKTYGVCLFGAKAMSRSRSGFVRRHGSILSAMLAAAMSTALLTGCSEPRTYREPATADPVVEERVQKDRMFKMGPESPIPREDRSGFQGLAYFPPDPGFRFHLKLNRYPNPSRVRLGTNTGELRDALRYGYFEFEVDGRVCRLQAYRTEEMQQVAGPRLFMPFRDATSGSETYGAGRYLELPENTSGIYEIDFNRAFNPYCAYNSRYSCPVPPRENTLPVAIRAGEKTYPLSHRSAE